MALANFWALATHDATVALEYLRSDLDDGRAGRWFDRNLARFRRWLAKAERNVERELAIRRIEREVRHEP